jgi:integrase
MRKAFETAAHRAGIKDLRWHDLRRTAGCRWLQRDGRSMEEVSAMLGHATVTITQRSYAFLDLEKTAQKAAQDTRTEGR